MNENAPEPKQPENVEPSSEEVINLLKGLKEQGADFEEDDIEHLREMELDEAIGYAFDVLLAAGIEDPEAILIEKGLLEPTESA